MIKNNTNCKNRRENMFFIHTFSLIKKYKSVDEIKGLWQFYKHNNLECKGDFLINQYAHKGVRLCARWSYVKI